MVCLDSDLLIGFLRGDEEAIAAMDEFSVRHEQLTTTPVNVTELYTGAYLSGKPHEKKAIDELFASMNLLEYDCQAAEEAGRIRAELQKQGQMIGFYDTLIAGVVLRHREILVTRNHKHFANVLGLALKSW